MTTSTKDLFGDRRCSEPIIQFLRSTEIGHRLRERGVEEDDPEGCGYRNCEGGIWSVDPDQPDDCFGIFVLTLM
jgi:hypothetical protein